MRSQKKRLSLLLIARAAAHEVRPLRARSSWKLLLPSSVQGREAEPSPRSLPPGASPLPWAGRAENGSFGAARA